MRCWNRKARSCVVLLALAYGAWTGAQGPATPWSAAGGASVWRFNPEALYGLGLRLETDGALASEKGAVRFAMTELGSMEFAAIGGEFKRLLAGSLPHRGGLLLHHAGGQVDLRHYRIQPHAKLVNAFEVVDVAGNAWLSLQYGHFDYEPQASRLSVRFMDVRLTGRFAAVLGDVRLAGAHLGSLDLETPVSVPDVIRYAKGSCSAATANWPTMPGFSVDIEMIAMDDVDQSARVGGQVAITPSAEFRNSGTGDAPWFAMFARPDNDPAFCIDDGSGNCQPYGNDQGGKLVWALYRIHDGRIEQLGRSAVKHAFNSINSNCACAAGRVVFAGCADRYATATNANQNYLGPRSEIEANSGIWNRAGSIFDSNGDDHCDVGGSFSFGEWPCNIGASDALERRMAVAEVELTTPGARYYLESWYVVRDDINIFNSMARREITPTFIASGNGFWTFPFAAAFELGPAVDLWVEPGTVVPGESSALLSTLEGDVRLTARAEDLGGNRWRYRFALMNFDFDRQVSRLSIPLPLGARAANAGFFDADQDVVNDWSATIEANAIRWDAPLGASLDWGSMASFEFDAALPPVSGQATVFALEAGAPPSFNVTAVNLLDDVAFLDSFED